MLLLFAYQHLPTVFSFPFMIHLVLHSFWLLSFYSGTHVFWHIRFLCMHFCKIRTKKSTQTVSTPRLPFRGFWFLWIRVFFPLSLTLSISRTSKLNLIAPTYVQAPTNKTKTAQKIKCFLHLLLHFFTVFRKVINQTHIRSPTHAHLFILLIKKPFLDLYFWFPSSLFLYVTEYMFVRISFSYL